MATERKHLPDDLPREARLEAELTRYLEWAQAEPVPPRILELARELQRRLREEEGR